jgi:hypothetical protein
MGMDTAAKTTRLAHLDEDLLDDFALAAMDFDGIEEGPVAKMLRKAFSAILEAVEIARQEEQAASWWTKKINDWVAWSRIKKEKTRRSAASLICRDFDDFQTAIDFLMCPPLDSLSLLSLSNGGRIPTNAYEVFAARRRGALAMELELAESRGPVEMYTYRLRMLRGLGESRTKIYRWRSLADRCGFRLLNKSADTPRQAPSGIKTKPLASARMATTSVVSNDVLYSDGMARVRDGP